MKKRKRFYWSKVIIIIAIMLAVIFFLISIGKIDFFDKTRKSLTSIEGKNDILNKRKELELQKQEKIRIKESLDIKAHKFYLYTKLLMAGSYIGMNVFGWFLLWSKDISQTLGYLLTYNQAAFIFYALIMFLIPRKPLNFFSLVQTVKLEIKKSLYSRHPELENEIKNIDIEIKKLDYPQKQLTML